MLSVTEFPRHFLAHPSAKPAPSTSPRCMQPSLHPGQQQHHGIFSSRGGWRGGSEPLPGYQAQHSPMLFPEPATAGSTAGWGSAGARVPRPTGSVLSPREELPEPSPWVHADRDPLGSRSLGSRRRNWRRLGCWWLIYCWAEWLIRSSAQHICQKTHSKTWS